MKHISFKSLRLALAGCALAVLATGCISETLDSCPKNRAIRLVVHGQFDNDLTGSGDVTDASLYLYDENNEFLEVINLTEAQIAAKAEIPLNYSTDKKIKVVAWGNIGGGRQNLNNTEASNKMNVTLKKNQNLAETPNILFSGVVDCRTIEADPLKTESIVDEVIIKQRVGKMTIFTKGLEYKLHSMGLRSDDEYDFEVKLHNTGSELTHTGDVSGDIVDYNPVSAGGLDDEGKYEWTTTEREGVLPSELIKVSIDLGDEAPIIAEEDQDGKLLSTGVYDPNSFQITFDEDGNFVGIVVVVRPWEYIPEEIEF